MSKIKLMIEMDKKAYQEFKESLFFIKATFTTEAVDAIEHAIPIAESDDCVSRQEAIHCVTETELYNETFAEAKMRIAELKPVLPKREQGEWISVSERLPETHKDSRLIHRKRSDEVMCKIKAEEDVINSCGYLIEHADGHKEWQTDCYMSDDDEVIAWMPFPKYEGVDE